MPAKIYKPAKNAMQSGDANCKKWLLEFEPENSRFIDPLMGWTGNADTKRQLKLKFSSLEEAENYAKRKGLQYRVIRPNTAKPKKSSYASNFL